MVYDAAALALVDQAMAGAAFSLRTRHNRLRMLRAIQVLNAAGISSKLYKATTLSELGRVADHTLLRRLAGEIYSRKLSTRQATNHVRAARLPDRRPGFAKLTQHLLRCIKTFREKYPLTTPEDVQEALSYTLALTKSTSR